MDFLRNLFGNLTSGIIRLLVSVGIIAAVGYFIVKPALDTANRSIDSYNKTFDGALQRSGGGAADIDRTIEDVNRRVQREIRRSFKSAQRNGDPQRLVKCIQRANGDVQRIKRCTAKF